MDKQNKQEHLKPSIAAVRLKLSQCALALSLPPSPSTQAQQFKKSEVWCLKTATTVVCYCPHLLGLTFSCFADGWSTRSWIIYLLSLTFSQSPALSLLIFVLDFTLEACDGCPCPHCFKSNSSSIIYVSGLLNDLPLQRSYAILKNTCVVENGSASSPEGSPIQ